MQTAPNFAHFFVRVDLQTVQTVKIMPTQHDPVGLRHPDDPSDESGVADMADDIFGAMPLQNSTVPVLDVCDSEPVIDGTKLGGSQRDPTRIGIRQVSGEAPLHAKIDRPDHQELPSYEQFISSDLVSKALQPLNEDTASIATNLLAFCTPASRQMYRIALRDLEFLGENYKPCEAEPPTYTRFQSSARDVQRLPRRKMFDHICRSVSYLDVKKLTAEDYEVHSRAKGDTWLRTLVKALTKKPYPDTYSHLVGALQEEYGEQIQASKNLIRPALMYIFLGREPADPEDKEETEWILNQKVQCGRFLTMDEPNLSELAQNEPFKACEELDQALHRSLVFIFIKHRIEVLSELGPCEPAMNGWLHHQLRAKDKWCEANDEYLGRLPGIASQIKGTWIFGLWDQWEDFLENGFDAPLANVWEPPLLEALLGEVPEAIKDLDIGVYPREIEVGDYDAGPNWLEADANSWEPGFYEDIMMGGRSVDTTITSDSRQRLIDV
ncbi:hypothetical protein FKW77_000549, partial [Venturia effusa]